jgi:trigger factor
MNVKKTVSEKLKQEFHVIIESDEIKRRVTDSLTSKIKNIKLPGFRPGKVPLHIVRQRFEESTTHEVINDVIQDSSRKVLKENKINPASEPTLELDTYEDGKDLSFRLKVETLPTIELPDFSKVSIKKIKSEVTDKDVEKAVEEHAKSRTFFVPAPDKAKAADSDLIKINLETHVDKNQIKQYTQNDVTIKLGDGRFLFPIIEKELLNKKVGDTFSIEHTFDAATPHKILSGKTANFTITVTLKKRFLILLKSRFAIGWMRTLQTWNFLKSWVNVFNLAHL